MTTLTVQNNSQISNPTTLLETEQHSNEFWQSRSVQTGILGFTTSQIQIFALRLLTGALGVGAVGVVTIAALGVVPLPLALGAIPLLLVGGLAFWKSTQIDDYEDEAQLAQYREEAMRMSLDEVARRHGWDEIFKYQLLTPSQFEMHYRSQVQNLSLNSLIDYYEKVSAHVDEANRKSSIIYTIPHPENWAAKWREETRTKTFEEIINDYSIPRMEKFFIVQQSELIKLRELTVIYHRLKATFQAEEQNVNADYDRATGIERQRLDQAKRLADQAYNDNWAVRELQMLDARILREKMDVNNQKMALIAQAKEHFNRAVAGITHEGCIPVNQLAPQERARYDQVVQEEFHAKQRAERDAAARIREIDLRNQIQRNQLDQQERAARATRDAAKADAQRYFDLQTAPARQQRDLRLAPARARFRDAVNDLNQRYLAFVQRMNL